MRTFQWKLNAANCVEHYYRGNCIYGNCGVGNGQFCRLAGNLLLGHNGIGRCNEWYVLVLIVRSKRIFLIRKKKKKITTLTVAGGIYQNSVYGMAAKLPFKYTGAVVLGSNISGTLTTIISIATSFFSSSAKTAGIYYFIGAMFVLLACFDTYFALPLNVSRWTVQYKWYFEILIFFFFLIYCS